jgi:uncharacterized membrane protein
VTDNATRSTPHMTAVVHRNIDALLGRREQEERDSTRSEKIADAITEFTGSMRFVVIHLVLFGTWIVWNSACSGSRVRRVLRRPGDGGVGRSDLPVDVRLISQNRMQARADERADLDLQISLLTEHEVTALAGLVRAIARRLDIRGGEPEFEEVLTRRPPERSWTSWRATNSTPPTAYACSGVTTQRGRCLAPRKGVRS